MDREEQEALVVPDYKETQMAKRAVVQINICAGALGEWPHVIRCRRSSSSVHAYPRSHKSRDDPIT
jgi:hypothetical protein